MLNFWSASMAFPLEEWRVNSQGRVVLFLATETICTNPLCGWNDFTQSGKLVDCYVCHGAGKTFSYVKQPILARVVWGNTQLRYVAPTPGVEIGDVTLGIVPGDLPVIQSVLDSERSYIEVDGLTVRPLNTSVSNIPGIEEAYLVTCARFTRPTY